MSLHLSDSFLSSGAAHSLSSKRYVPWIIHLFHSNEWKAFHQPQWDLTQTLRDWCIYFFLHWLVLHFRCSPTILTSSLCLLFCSLITGFFFSYMGWSIASFRSRAGKEEHPCRFLVWLPLALTLHRMAGCLPSLLLLTLFRVSPSKASCQILHHTKQQDEQSWWAACCTQLMGLCLHFQVVLPKRLSSSCHTSRPLQKQMFPSRCPCTLLSCRRIHQSLLFRKDFS